MICDNISNIQLYQSVHPGFARAFAWLATTDLSALPEGRTEIDGKNLWVSTTRGPTRYPEEGLWEAHREYIDIQFVASGTERIDWADLKKSKPGTYNAEKDFLPLDTLPMARIRLSEGQFALFFPGDAHMPGLCIDKPAAVTKYVVKVRVGWQG